jgi:hypothetical protein
MNSEARLYVRKAMISLIPFQSQSSQHLYIAFLQDLFYCSRLRTKATVSIASIIPCHYVHTFTQFAQCTSKVKVKVKVAP